MDKGFEKFMSAAIGRVNVENSPVNMDVAIVEAMAKGIISIGRKHDDGIGQYFSIDIIFATLANTFNEFQDVKFSTVMYVIDHSVNGSFMSLQQHLGKRYSTTFLGSKESLQGMVSGLLMTGLNESMKSAIKTTDIVATGFKFNFERGSLMHKLISIDTVPDEEIAKILATN